MIVVHVCEHKIATTMLGLLLTLTLTSAVVCMPVSLVDSSQLLRLQPLSALAIKVPKSPSTGSKSGDQTEGSGEISRHSSDVASQVILAPLSPYRQDYMPPRMGNYFGRVSNNGFSQAGVNMAPPPPQRQEFGSNPGLYAYAYGKGYGGGVGYVKDPPQPQPSVLDKVFSWVLELVKVRKCQ